MRHAASHARASGLHIARLRCGSLGKDQAHAGRAAEGREGGREGGREREREREREENESCRRCLAFRVHRPRAAKRAARSRTMNGFSGARARVGKSR